MHPTHTTASFSADNDSPRSLSSARSPHTSAQIYDFDGAEDALELQSIAPIEDALRDNDAGQRAQSPENVSLLPNTRRFSVGSAQSEELYTREEEKRVLKTLDRRLVLFMALLYCLSFLDRSNIGNARIAGLAKDLDLTSVQYEWLLWAFYITYIAFEWMALMYRLVPPHIYISICILSWGIIASLQAVATRFEFLLLLRLCLGVGEAAFGPGVPFYLSFFFRRDELAFRTGLFISASPLSASFAGTLAWLITKIGQNGPISPWRLLFLIEGFPSVLVAVWAWDFVPDSPGKAKWLTPRQQQVAVLRLRQEKGSKSEDQTDEKEYSSSRKRKGVNFGEVLEALKDPKSYLTAFMFFSCNVAFSSMPVFLPTIIRDMGHQSITAQALCAPPYFFAFVVVLITAYYSDRLRSRSAFIILHSVVATLGYGALTICGYYKFSSIWIRYFALFPAAAGFFSAVTIIITWTINNQESDSKKGAGIAIMNIIGQMGPLLGTSIFPNEDGPYYVKGMTICAGFMLLVGVLAAILRSVLLRENNLNERKRRIEFNGIPLEDGIFTAIITMESARHKSEGTERASSIASSSRRASSTDQASTAVGSPELGPNYNAPMAEFKPESDVEKLPGIPRGDTEEIAFSGEEENTAVPISFQRSGAGYETFSLYETSTRFYLIDRTAPPVYDKREMNQLLNTIDDGNKHTGGMRLKCSTWGLLGFVRFTEAYYMLLITKRAQVAMIGGHYIYQVDGTELKDRNPDEARFLNILTNIDLTRFFYFSYSYNITRSLQQNIIREREALNEGRPHPNRDFQDMFATLKNVYDWCHPIIHGSVDQSSLDVFGRRIYITLLARRSRYFAGARFLKRGTNDLGYVANDVETEQIVSEALTTSFHAPGPRLFSNPGFSSYVQHRGSIPLHWTQDNSGVSYKPDIDLNLPDPFFTAAALHFDNLFERYGAPIYVLNLIKQRERTPRESKLLYEYKHAKIIYEAFDMARASKTRGQDKVIRQTGFFHNGDNELGVPQVQNGVARTNCIDCLDRTNAAQFVIAKRALGRQLQALDCVDNFTHMFHNHGDAIAMQYGGSHLWQSSSRDMRQEAYNLFLGYYTFQKDGPMLWDLITDYYLHHGDPRKYLERPRRNYIQWYTPENLEPRSLPPLDRQIQVKRNRVDIADDYWLEYYRPLAVTSFLKKDTSYPTRQQNASPFVDRKQSRKGVTILDPVSEGDSRKSTMISRRHRSMHLHIPEIGSPVKQSILRDTAFEPHVPNSVPAAAGNFPSMSNSSSTGLYEGFRPADKALVHLWTLAQFHENSINPTVSGAEEEEYYRYIEHPLNLPLVVSSETPVADDPTAQEFQEYLDMTDGTNVQQAYQDTGDSSSQESFMLVKTETASIRSFNNAAGGMGARPTTSSSALSYPLTPFSHPSAHHHGPYNNPYAHNHSEHLQAHLQQHPLYPESIREDPETLEPAAGTGAGKFQTSVEDIEEFDEFLTIKENPLDVEEADGGKKRYKAYRQWLRGKSFFKQSKVDPEWQNQLPMR
ncbi:hypothetical protein DM02DRAFT_640542 [Periconia macrospinosa]|uniref:SAC domain-containing protein n=1 Tax=Periconia macrospinosa TaxID=97972 RepID=A0A2V1E1I9_9PLEO|nr:hypothetical protein DM02DRAFT_640542 [Periconia macrospinosa]